MKVTILIDNPKEDKILVGPLIENLQKLIAECVLRPCVIEFDGANLMVTPARKEAKNKGHKSKKVA